MTPVVTEAQLRAAVGDGDAMSSIEEDRYRAQHPDVIVLTNPESVLFELGGLESRS